MHKARASTWFDNPTLGYLFKITEIQILEKYINRLHLFPVAVEKKKKPAKCKLEEGGSIFPSHFQATVI